MLYSYDINIRNKKKAKLQEIIAQLLSMSISLKKTFNIKDQQS